VRKLLFIFVGILLFICCEDATKPDQIIIDDPDSTESFSGLKVHTVYDGYVILHTIDGNDTLEVQSVNAGDTAIFYNIDTSHVTFSIIYKQESLPYINTYFEVPKGEYNFNRSINYENVNFDDGYAKFDFEFPDSIYNNPWINCPKSTKILSENHNEIVSVNTITSENKFKALCLAKDEEGYNVGFYQWIDDDNFQPRDTNYYNTSIANSIQRKTITSNIPITTYNVNTLCKNSGAIIYQHTNALIETSTEVSIPYAPNIDENDWYGLNIVAENERGNSQQYFQKSNEIPDHVEILELSAITNFDNETGVLSEVSINGDVDFIQVAWHSPREVSRQLWISYYPNTKTILKRPVIPQNILDEYEISSVNPIWPLLILEDLDNVNGYDVEYIFSNKNAMFYCDSYYSRLFKPCFEIPDEKAFDGIKDKYELQTLYPYMKEK